MSKNKIKVKQQNKPNTTPPAVKPKRTVIKKATTQTDYYFWGYAFVILLITFFVFKHSLTLQFVNWDDPYNLLENETLKIFSYSWDWNAVKTIFKSDVIGNYNPLPIFTFAIEKYFFAPNPVLKPSIFHLNNLWMHLVCTLFVFILFKKLGLSKPAAIIGALLFGIHPMRVESVAWITERKDVLYGMFFLAALLSYINYVRAEKNNKIWYGSAILLAVVACFAKVQAVTLPLTMVALDFYFKRKWLSPKILIIEKLPWWLLSLTFGLINIYTLKGQNSLNSDSHVVAFNFIDKLAVGAYSYAIYLIKWIYPYKLSPLYPYPPELPIQAYICLAVVPILMAAFLFWIIKYKKNDLFFGWMFFTFNIMFLLQIVGAGQGFLADRFTYIAYIGLFFIMIKGYDWLTENRPSFKIPLMAAAGMYLALFGFLTTRQLKVWENSATLWEHVKIYYPDSPLAWKQAANYYRDEKKDFAKAVANYQQAIKMEPQVGYTYNGLAKAYLDQAFRLDPKMINYKQEQNELVQQALQSYILAVQKDSIKGQPDKKITGEMIVNLGVAYAILGNMDEAMIHLSRGILVNPDNSNGYLNRGLIYFNAGQYALAIKDYDEYIRLNPYNADIFYSRGMCKFAVNRVEESLPDYNKAIVLKATEPLFYIARSRTYRSMGNISASINDANKAKQMGATVPPELLQ